MTITDLTYKLTEFFFNNFWHFVMMIFLILVLKDSVERWLISFRRYIEKVKQNYRARIIRKEALPKLKDNIPPIVKNYNKRPDIPTEDLKA